MEKCTFCVQRINKGKIDAEAENRPLKDGGHPAGMRPVLHRECAGIRRSELDPESAVSRLANSPRGTKLLEEMGAKPQITYLQREIWNEPSTHKS